jgi:cytochrome c peroxidase
VWNPTSQIGKFKGPILRDLAARAPSFHTGSAARLDDVDDSYDVRFRIGFSRHEQDDLLALLRAL